MFYLKRILASLSAFRTDDFGESGVDLLAHKQQATLKNGTKFTLAQRPSNRLQNQEDQIVQTTLTIIYKYLSRGPGAVLHAQE